MKAKLKERVIADSDDIVEEGGYSYFPSAAVRLDLLRKADKTVSDGVQFYDVVLDGTRHERAAWRYEAPRPSMKHVAGRFSFWDEVEVG
jgi:uncharacterized protein (DUF427 family)